MVETPSQTQLYVTRVRPLVLLETHVAIDSIAMLSRLVEQIVNIQTERKTVFQEALVDLKLKGVDAANGEIIVGSATAIAIGKVDIPSLGQVEAVVDVEDVVRIVKTFHRPQIGSTDKALLYACLHLRLIPAPTVAVAHKSPPVPAMTHVVPRDVTHLRLFGEGF